MPAAVTLPNTDRIDTVALRRRTTDRCNLDNILYLPGFVRIIPHPNQVDIAYCEIKIVAYCVTLDTLRALVIHCQALRMKTVLIFARSREIRKIDKLMAIYDVGRSESWIMHCLYPDGAFTPANAVRILKPDGIIIEGSANTRDFAFLRHQKLPTVLLDFGSSGMSEYPLVLSDARKIAELAFDELSALDPKSFLFVSSFPDMQWSKARQKAFLAHCAQDRKPCIRFLSKEAPFNAIDSLASHLLSLPRPIGVFSANDESAELVYRAVEKAKLKFGRDLTLVSVDNDPLVCGNHNPPLSSISQNAFLAGQTAARLLARVMSGEALSSQHVFVAPQGLIRRASSAALCKETTLARSLIQDVGENGVKPLSISELAHRHGVSRRTAEKAFKSATGKTLHTAMLDLRFEAVERLLTNPRQQLGPIAELCGWRSSAHLKRAFHQRYGMTMSQWRSKRLSPDVEQRA